jgi:hypothetical protein
MPVRKAADKWLSLGTSLSIWKVRKIGGFVCGRTILHSWIGLDVKPPNHQTIVCFYKLLRQL